MSDAKFIPGLFFKPPNDGAPEFILAKGSIKIADLIQFLQRQEGEWVNFDLKRSREGKPYAAIDDWKPQGGAGATRGGPPQRAPAARQAPPPPADDFEDSEIPF